MLKRFQFRIDGIQLFLALRHEWNGQRQVFVAGAESAAALRGVRLDDMFMNNAHDLNFELFDILTNDFERSAYTITQYYRKRWKIELLFKQLKQNFPLRTFLGDNENAIKIQIWITLIANLIVQVIKNRSKSKLSFSNIVAMIRVHLSTYIHLYKFIRNPEKSLRENEKVSIKKTIQHELFDT